MTQAQFMKQWETGLAEIEGIIPLNTPEARKIFGNLVALHWQEGYESLQYSYGYYLITGRRGAWLYVQDETMCVICWHPNRDGHVLLYPAIGSQASEMLAELLEVMPKPPVACQIARVQTTDNHADFMANHLMDTCGDILKTVSVKDEAVLDWLYPVRVLSTIKATEKSGSDLHGVRKEYRKLDQSQIEFRPYTGNEYQALKNVAHTYTTLFLDQNNDCALSYDEIMQPIMDVLDLCLEHQDLFDIRVTWYKGEPKGYFVWEKLTDKTANALWFLYDRSIRGLSYTQMVKACEFMKKKGIERVNFGGSETSGLDMFKRKFKPVQSFHMKSIEIEFAKEQHHTFANSHHIPQNDNYEHLDTLKPNPNPRFGNYSPT